jgi:hypothetical protein
MRKHQEKVDVADFVDNVAASNVAAEVESTERFAAAPGNGTAGVDCRTT